MRSFDAVRLLKGITLATALVVGASAQLPFQLQAQQVSASDGVFRENVLLELFSDPANSEDLKSLSAAELEQRGFVKDAKGGIYKIISREVRSEFGTHKVSTQDLVQKNYYKDSVAGKSVIRKKSGSSAHPFDPVIYGLSLKMNEHLYYDFGGKVNSDDLNSDALAQLRAYVEARGGRLVTDANGRLIGFDFGSSNLQSNDEVMRALMAFFGGQTPQVPNTGGSVVIDGSGFKSTGDPALDALLAVLYGANGGGASGSIGVIHTPGAGQQSAGNGLQIYTGPNGASNGAGGNGVIFAPGTLPQANGAGGQWVYIPGGNQAGNKGQQGPNGYIFGNENPSGNQGPNVVLIPGQNGYSGGVNLPGVVTVPGSSNPNPNTTVVVDAGSTPGTGRWVVRNGRVVWEGPDAGNGGGASTDVTLTLPSTHSQAVNSGGFYQLPGNGGGNGSAQNQVVILHTGARQTPDGYYIFDGSSFALKSRIGAGLNEAGLPAEILAYHYAHMHQQLGMDLVDQSKITNLSDIQKSNEARTLTIGDYKYALTRVQVKEGGLFGRGSESVWVMTQEVPGEGYRLVSPEEQAMLVAYAKMMLKEAEDKNDKAAFKRWKKLIEKIEDENLTTYKAGDYNKVIEFARDPKSKKSSLATGTKYQYSVSNGLIVFGGQNATAPGAGHTGAQIMTPDASDKFTVLSNIFYQNQPDANAEAFTLWLMNIAQNKASSGNADLDAWLKARFASNASGNTPSVNRPAVSVESSTERVAAYILTPRGNFDENGKQEFKLTRFFKQSGHEFDHKTTYVFLGSDEVHQNADGSWVLIGESAAPVSAPSAAPNTGSNPSNNNSTQQVDHVLKRLEQLITSVRADFVDENGQVVSTTHARIEPGVSASALKAFVESQGSKLIFDDAESKDLRN